MAKKDATLIMKEVKAGGTFRALQEAKKWTDRKQCAVLFCQNSRDIKNQEIAAAVKAGISRKDIVDVAELNSWKTKDFLNENSWRGKLFVCNKNQVYYPSLMALKPSIENNALRIIDEYDVENTCHTDGLAENIEKIKRGTSTSYSQIDQGLINIIGEHNEDNLWLVSATHSSGLISNWSFKVIELDPWHPNYKGMKDHKEVEVANTTMNTLLENAELTGAIREFVLKSTIEYKLLINTTKRVNGGENEIVTHARIAKACRELGKVAIEVNGTNPYDSKKWDEAEIVIGGSVFDRTFEAREIYTQITAYSSTGWYGSIEQQERLCGVKKDPNHPTMLILSETDVEKRKEVLRLKKEITAKLMEMTWEERKDKLPEFKMNPYPGNKSNGGKLTRKNMDNYEPLLNLPVLPNGKPDLSNFRQEVEILSEFRLDDGETDGTGLSIRDIHGYGNKCSIDIATVKRTAGEVKIRLAANLKNDLGLKKGERIAEYNKYILGKKEERLKRAEELPNKLFLDAQFDKENQWYTVYTKKHTTGTKQYIKRDIYE